MCELSNINRDSLGVSLILSILFLFTITIPSLFIVFQFLGVPLDVSYSALKIRRLTNTDSICSHLLSERYIFHLANFVCSLMHAIFQGGRTQTN